MPSDHTTGITANRGNLHLQNGNIVKTGEENYGHLLTGKNIQIEGSQIHMVSAGTNLIWSSDGDITIADSEIALSASYGADSRYLIFAEMGSIRVSGESTIEIVSGDTDDSEDQSLFVATNGIQLDNSLQITDGAGIHCEIYHGGWQYSVRYSERQYPAKVSVA